MRKIRKVHADSMRPHTHTRRAAHAPASHLEPNRTSKPKSKLREARVCDIAQTAHAPRLLRAEARSSQRTQDTTHDTHSDEPCPDSHADAKTRRACTEQRHADAPRTKQGTTARCGSVPASCATASLATYMPWYCPPPSARSAAAAALARPPRSLLRAIIVASVRGLFCFVLFSSTASKRTRSGPTDKRSVQTRLRGRADGHADGGWQTVACKPRRVRACRCPVTGRDQPAVEVPKS